jgi:hypothetical protein
MAPGWRITAIRACVLAEQAAEDMAVSGGGADEGPSAINRASALRM